MKKENPIDRRKFLKWTANLATVGACAAAGAYLSNYYVPKTSQSLTRTVTEPAQTVTIERTIPTLRTVTTERITTKYFYGNDVQIGRDTFKYFANPDADAILFFLAGGEITPDSKDVEIWGFEDEKSNFFKERKAFFQILYENGLSIVTNRNDLTYSGSDRWVRDVSDWCSPTGVDKKPYPRKFFGGYSGGGEAVAHFITTEENDFDAAIVINAPIDHETFGSLAHSALRAYLVKIPVCFIYGEVDPSSSYIEEARTYRYLMHDEIREKSGFYPLPGIGHEVWKDDTYQKVAADSIGFLKWSGYL